MYVCITCTHTIIFRYIFCGFRILCILLESNFALASRPQHTCAEYKCMRTLLHEIERAGTMRKLAAAWSKGG